MIVKTQKPISFDNKANAIYNTEDLILAIFSRAIKPVCRAKMIFMHGQYPAISIYGKKYHIHRLIAEYKLGRMLSRNESAHHKDNNRLNALWENISILHQGNHAQHHLAGKKQDADFAFRRTNASCLAKYGHPRIHENPELLEDK